MLLFLPAKKVMNMWCGGGASVQCIYAGYLETILIKILSLYEADGISFSCHPR